MRQWQTAAAPQPSISFAAQHPCQMWQCSRMAEYSSAYQSGTTSAKCLEETTAEAFQALPLVYKEKYMVFSTLTHGTV